MKKEYKKYAVPEQFLLDIILTFYDIKNKNNEIANNLLRKLSYYSVQLLAEDIGFPLGDILKKRIDEIKIQLDEKGDIISYTEL
jgi:hypothetical protein